MGESQPVMWILLSVLWLLVGSIIGYMIRGARATEVLESHNERLMDLLFEQTPSRGLDAARIRDTEAESPEAVAQQRMVNVAIDELAAHIAEQGGVSIAAARTEAEQMLGQFEAPAQDMPDFVRNESNNF